MPKIITQIALGLWGITPGDYSAIVPVDQNVYAIVDDKDQTDGYKLLELEVDRRKGKLAHAQLIETVGMTQRRADGVGTNRDCEGACYFAPAGTVFVSGEAHQDILEYDREGNPTGRHLAVPDCMSRTKIAINLGFEALTYNAVQHRFWTTTEGMLPADGSLLPTISEAEYNPLHPLQTSAKLEPVETEQPHQSAEAFTPVEDGRSFNIDQQDAPTAEVETELLEEQPQIRLRLLSFDDKLQPSLSYIYRMDDPIANQKEGNGVHGVASLLALDNGKMLVLEREGFCPKWKLGAFVNHKIYIVDLTQEQPVKLDTPMTEVSDEQVVKKELLVEFKTKFNLFKRTLANYEGMCLGPRLDDGRQTLLLIADSQHGMGNIFFHLKDFVGIYAFDREL